jgi:hypothetical protein
MQKIIASAALIATAGLGIGTATAVTSAQASACNPNSGCLPRPPDANQAGGAYSVRPHTVKIERGGPELTAYGMHWSRWTGGYGRHGLIAGRARGIGYLRGCDEGCFRLGRVRIVLSDVTNFGVNAATYYERLHIIGGKHVAHYWRWSWRYSSYVP